jgi:hypothetical protein
MPVSLVSLAMLRVFLSRTGSTLHIPPETFAASRSKSIPSMQIKAGSLIVTPMS